MGGRAVVISGPSGAGKTSVIRRLLAQEPRFWLSVSATTRPPRPGERHGVDYLFLSREQFERLRAEGGLLEWAEVYGELYGTPRAPLEQALAEGRVALLDIDTQGARSLRQSGLPVTCIMIVPPSFQVLAERLRGRASEDQAGLERRLARARAELAEAPAYDAVVTNDDLERCVAEVRRLALAGVTPGLPGASGSSGRTP
ncbi:MAG: guanylate kinase [Planctomycetota bacterium]|nr:MAG: guanylate kinase [Planctomycetota bacterium]